MKQIKKTLCTLALGLFGVLTMNAQENLVKNGDFNEGINHWETNSTAGSIEIDPVDVQKPGTDDRTPLLIKSFKPNGAEYAYQKIEGEFSGKNFDFQFASLVWSAYFNAELEWSTGQIDKLEINDDNGYQWKMDNRLTGQAPIGAVWVKIRFTCIEIIDTSDPKLFLIDDVSLTVSGKAIIPTPLDAPKNVEVSNVAKDKFTLSWGAVEKADGYEIKVNGQTVKVASNTTTYNVENLTAGEKYPVSIKGYSSMTATIDNKNGVADLDVFTLGNEKTDGTNVFFEGGDFTNGTSDLNKGWRADSSISITGENIDGDNSTKMRIQNRAIAFTARSYDFSVEAGQKYSFSSYVNTPDKNQKITFNVVWKKANGDRIETETIGVSKENYDSWETIANELTAPTEAVVAEIQFQLPAGDHHGGIVPIFYVDDVKVIKGAVAPSTFKVTETNQRNATLSWGAIEGKSYKVVINGKTLEVNGNMIRINGLVPNTEYTAEVYSTDAESKKSTVTFKTNDFAQPEGERIAYLSNIDENGVIPQEFFYNISELDGDAIKAVEFTYNDSPVQESEPGKISLPATEGKKLMVKITQENGNQTTLTYYVVTFKK